MALRLIQRRYSKLMLDSKIGVIPRNTIQQSMFSTTHLHASSHKSPTISHPIFRNSASHNRFYFKNREYEEQGRFYFKNREYDDDDEGYWFHDPKRVRFTLFFFTCGALIGVSSGKSVTVPFTERSHFILFYKIAKLLEEEHTTYTGKLLPPFHPDSITARRIFQDIIHQAFPFEIEIKRSLQEKENEYQDKPDCEIIIFDWVEDLVSGCGRFGKIFVSSGLLHHYEEHEEMLATIFGGEVGHDLARHNEELLSKSISLVSGIGMSFYLFSKSAYVRSKLPYFDKFMRLRFIPSFSLVATVSTLSYVLMMMYHRKMEIEADRIGLMLAASAGYNPEVGVLYPVHGDELNATLFPECLSFFPSGRTRNLYLSQPQVLDEAIFKYRQSLKSSTGTTDSTEA